MQIRGNLASDYADIYTPAALDALKALAVLDPDRKTLMAARLARREERARSGRRIEFLDPDALIGRTSMPVRGPAVRRWSTSGPITAAWSMWPCAAGAGATTQPVSSGSATWRDGSHRRCST